MGCGSSTAAPAGVEGAQAQKPNEEHSKPADNAAAAASSSPPAQPAAAHPDAEAHETNDDPAPAAAGGQSAHATSASHAQPVPPPLNPDAAASASAAAAAPASPLSDANARPEGQPASPKAGDGDGDAQGNAAGQNSAVAAEGKVDAASAAVAPKQPVPEEPMPPPCTIPDHEHELAFHLTRYNGSFSCNVCKAAVIGESFSQSHMLLFALQHRCPGRLTASSLQFLN